MKVIALEEHFVTADVLAAWRNLDPRWRDLALEPSSCGDSGRRLLEIGRERFAAMSDMGVDMQVLSLTAPGLQNLDAAEAAALQAPTNDLLAEAVAAHPDRLQGLATLATQAPEAAAKELERAVTTLGLEGAMVYGRARKRNLDHPSFWPIFEAAEALRAPIYLHAQSPSPSVRDAYYSGFDAQTNAIMATHGIGWHYETGMQLLRLVVAGVFDRFPDLQVVVGHWGELLVFFLDRIDHLADPQRLRLAPSDYIRRNVHVTPSGMFSRRHLGWAIETVGIDRILFSTDYPFEMPQRRAALDFLDGAGLSESEKARITSGNWNGLRAHARVVTRGSFSAENTGPDSFDVATRSAYGRP